MIEVEKLIYGRLDDDSAAGVTIGGLIGTSKIFAGYQTRPAEKPLLMFWKFTQTPGTIHTDGAKTWELFYQFQIFSDRYPEVAERLRKLLDGWMFTVPAGYNDIGSLSSVFDWEGPDDHDDALNVGRKDLRFRFFAGQKAFNPIG